MDHLVLAGLDPDHSRAMTLDHPLIIQTIRLDLSRAVWTDGASNVSS
jgi:hypothetical protein